MHRALSYPSNDADRGRPTYGPGPRRVSSSSMRALYSYPAVQLWAEAVNRTGTAELQAVAFSVARASVRHYPPNRWL